MWNIKAIIGGRLYTHNKTFKTFKEAEKEKNKLANYYEGIFLEQKEDKSNNVKNLWQYAYQSKEIDDLLKLINDIFDNITFIYANISFYELNKLSGYSVLGNELLLFIENGQCVLKIQSNNLSQVIVASFIDKINEFLGKKLKLIR
jgi:hypothetical protein